MTADTVAQPITRDGELWYPCPIDGYQCAHVKAALGATTCADVLAVHVTVRHTRWPPDREST